ncbi:MAG: PGF-pre-PGF domain-containing protein [Methanosarcinaceae archaeon]|nr:PGF-pre-PGF domain-containing protein [Methanosarcinaceae archaeon]
MKKRNPFYICFLILIFIFVVVSSALGNPELGKEPIEGVNQAEKFGNFLSPYYENIIKDEAFKASSLNENLSNKEGVRGNLPDEILSGEEFSEDTLFRESLSPTQKKLSSELRQLVNPEFLPPGQTQKSLKSGMQELGQLKFSEEKPELIGSPLQNKREIKAGEEEKVYVYLYLNPDAESQRLEPYCELIEKDEENHLATAWVKVEALESLASRPEIKRIRTVMPPRTRVGSVSTEGDFIHNASFLRENYNVRGAGIKIGIISDGVESYKEAVASGDLPKNLTVLDNSIGGDEGTAMLEIVHDLAPDAELYFHACGNSTLEFNRAIDALADSGCKIICDDISWITEPFFEDGIVATHVEEVIKTRNILYVSSAGNRGSAHYQGMYYENGVGGHDFSRGTNESKNLYLSIPPGGDVIVILEWDDLWEASDNDYNLYLINNTTLEKNPILEKNTSLNIIAASENTQDGNGLPLEYLYYKNEGKKLLNATIYVHKKAGKAKELEIYLYPSVINWVLPYNIVGKDSIFGHPAVPEAVAVGAVKASSPEEIEFYSSRGPVSIVYPVSEKRAKPDLCGVDGVSVTGIGFCNPFYGTSASAPHIAALSGLVWSANPEKSNADIRRLLQTSALDLGALGYDEIYGYGNADVLEMYKQAQGISRILTVNPEGGADYETIQEALNHSIPGDTLLLAPGHYKENLKLEWKLTICSGSENPKDTLIEAANPDKPVFYVTADSVSIKGVSVKGAAQTCGIYLEQAEGCILKNNSVSENRFGIWLKASRNNTLRNNSMSNNSYNFGVYGEEKYLLNDIDQSNRVDGKQICYLLNTSDKTAEFFKDAGTIYCINCQNLSLQNLNLTKNYFGLYFYNTSNFSIENSSISENLMGIGLENSWQSQLYKNKISNNTYGIGLQASQNNELSKNKILNNSLGIGVLNSSKNSFFLNDFNNSMDILEVKTETEKLNNSRNSTKSIPYLYSGRVYSSRLGNFYANYRGPDSDENGIGDTVYENDFFPLKASFEAYENAFSLGNLTPSEPESIEGDLMEFEACSTEKCNFTWLIDGKQVQTNYSETRTWLSIDTAEILERRDRLDAQNSENSFTVSYNVSLLAEQEIKTLWHSWNWTIYRTEENRSRIEQLLTLPPVARNENSSYIFDIESEALENRAPEEQFEPVLCRLSFDSSENFGKLCAKLEVLNEKPAGAENTSPEGPFVYRYVNLELNNSSLSDSDLIQNRTLAFRIANSWIEENKLDPKTVSLERYHAGKWNLLKTTEESRASEYMYFKAETPGFSSFAFTACQNSEENPELLKRSESRGSGGRRGGSFEPANNIEIKELSQQFITNGKPVIFIFPQNVTCITSVKFDPKISAGKTTTIVEILKNKSEMVSDLPAGLVYKNINIWVGNAKTTNPETLENARVAFRVEKAWLSEIEMETTALFLFRYEANNWTQLSTKQSGEDENYLYFESNTSGFANFAIVAQKAPDSLKLALESQDKDKIDWKMSSKVPSELAKAADQEVGASNPDAKAPNKKPLPNPSFAINVALLLAGVIYLKKK